MDFYTAQVAQDIADLIPGYLENRRKEADQLAAFLEANDFEGLAHRMIGVGAPYGFRYISDIAKAIREAANAKDPVSLTNLIGGYQQYLRLVKVVFV